MPAFPSLMSRTVPLASLPSIFSSISTHFTEFDLMDIDSMYSTRPKSDPIRSDTSPLRRGKACAVCRAHKIRCDGVRPICGSCRRKPKADACEWDTSQSKSKVATLEETIETLKARIFELEHPELVTPSVTLHHPYRRDEEESLSHCSTPLSNCSTPLSNCSPPLYTQSNYPNPSFSSPDSYWDTATPTADTGISSITSINGESVTGSCREFEYARTAFPRQDASGYCLYRKDAVESCATSTLSAALTWQSRSS